MEQVELFSSLHDRMDQLSWRNVRKWGRPREIAGEFMEEYLQFISWRHDMSFQVKVRDSACSRG